MTYNSKSIWRFHKHQKLYFIYFILFYFIWLFRATPLAHGSSQARGQIGAIAAGLYHSHSNSRSMPHLQPAPQSPQCQILNPLSKAKDQTCVLMDTGQIHFHWATTGTSPLLFSKALLISFKYIPIIQNCAIPHILTLFIYSILYNNDHVSKA